MERVFAAKRITSSVEVTGLKLIVERGIGGLARAGMARAHRYMTHGHATIVDGRRRDGHRRRPCARARRSASGASSPPAIVPMRIAMKVPASTSALPPTSSLWRRCCGISEYLSGPKMVASTPNRKITVSSVGTSADVERDGAGAHQHDLREPRLPDQARSSRTCRRAARTSAENRKNGRMNSPCDTFDSMPASPPAAAAPKVIETTTRVAEQVVVERAEELREEEGQEAAGAEQPELRRFRAGNLFGKLHQAVRRQDAWCMARIYSLLDGN